MGRGLGRLPHRHSLKIEFNVANLDLMYAPNDRSRAFENHTTGYLICLAGPGTGKTYSFLKRIEALQSRGVSEEAICYLTFIKEISNAFIQDYIEKFGSESYEANKPRISTLHSFACRLLRNQGFQIGYDGELYFSSASDKESDAAKTLLTDLLKFVNVSGCSTEAQLRCYIDQIKGAWRDNIAPSSLPDPIPAILTQAESLFRAFRFVDWDQTIPMAHSLACDVSELPRWITDIKHYLIDEYQDFNKAEQDLIFFLSGHATSAVVVGDDDQSLYKSRGGSPDGLRSLYADTTHDQVSLVNCHRCRETIVSAANTFLSSMRANPRQMLPVKEGGTVLVFHFKSSKAELTYLTDFLQNCISEMPALPKAKDSTICLFPSWKVLEEYYDKLSPNVPCAKRKMNMDLKRRWLERVFHLVFTPEQRFIQRLLLNEYEEVKPRHKKLIVQLVIDNDISVLSAVQSLTNDSSFSGQVDFQLREFCKLIEDITSQEASRIVPHICQKLAIDNQVIEPHLSELLRKLNQPEKEEIINETCNLILPESAAPVEDPRTILFLTMHGSKGLTKKNVVMPGLEASWLPGDSTGVDLEERRRLFYVALTRATDRVIITFPRTRGRNDRLNFRLSGRGNPSSFIADAGLVSTYHD